MKEAARYFVLALALRAVWAVVIPPLYAPDEAAHLRTIRFFSERMRLATAEEIQSGAHGFYIASSPLPHLPFILGDRAATAMTGAPAPLLALRLAAALCGALLVLFASVIAQRVFPLHPLRWALPLACALHPQLVFVTAHVGWDPLSILAATALIATWPGLIGDRLTARRVIFAGVSAGFVLLVKPTSFCVLPVHAVIFAAAVLRQREAALFHIGLAALACGVVAGPFLVHNWWLFPGDPFAIGAILHTPGVDWEPGRPAVGNLLLETRFLLNTFESAWALFGFMDLKIANTVYALIALTCVASTFGLARAWRAHLLPAPVFLAAGAAALAFAFASSYWTSVTNDYQPQGRYFFAAIVPMLALWLTGLQALVRSPRRAMIVTTAALVLLNAYSLAVVRAHA